MKHRGYIGITAIIAVCVALLTVAMAASPTISRYENTVSWKSVYAPGVIELSSNYLTREGQTVLLQPWQVSTGTSRTEELVFTTNMGAVDARLSCTTDSPYITATVDHTQFSVDENGYIANLRLVTTDASEELTQRTEVVVKLALTVPGQEEMNLQADCLITLLPAQSESTQTQEQALPAADLSMELPQEQTAFAWAEKLIFTLTVEGNADTVELMYAGDCFPAGTRLRIGQQQPMILANDMTVALPVTDSFSEQIWLDFSRTQIAQPQQVYITAAAYRQGVFTGSADISLPATGTSLVLQAEDITPLILGSSTLTVPLTADTQGLSWELTHLTRGDNGPEYVSSADNFSLIIQPLQDTEDTGKLQGLRLSNEAGTAPAGTYCLKISRQCGGVEIAACQFVFYINY